MLELPRDCIVGYFFVREQVFIFWAAIKNRPRFAVFAIFFGPPCGLYRPLLRQNVLHQAWQWIFRKNYRQEYNDLHPFRLLIAVGLQERKLWLAYTGNFPRHNNNAVQHHADSMSNDTLTRGIENNVIVEKSDVKKNHGVPLRKCTMKDLVPYPLPLSKCCRCRQVEL